VIHWSTWRSSKRTRAPARARYVKLKHDSEDVQDPAIVRQHGSARTATRWATLAKSGNRGNSDPPPRAAGKRADLEHARSGGCGVTQATTSDDIQKESLLIALVFGKHVLEGLRSDGSQRRPEDLWSEITKTA
jgi:hypothetical protein